MNFFEKMKGFLLEPSTTFNACKEESLYEAMKYYLYLSAIISVIVFIGSALFFPKIDPSSNYYASFGLGIFFGIFLFVFSMIYVFFDAAIIHIGVYIWGGRKGFVQTIKACVYSIYISILLSILLILIGIILFFILDYLLKIPDMDNFLFINDIMGIIIFLWPWAIIIIGVRQLHEITTLRATIGVLFIPFIILAIFIIVIGPMINGLITEDYRTYGTNEDSILSVLQTSDGGYIMAGETGSYGAGSYDAWLIKTDANGNQQWNKTFGGIEIDKARSVQQTWDGGYLLSGETSFPSDWKTDTWFIKTDSNGDKQWNLTFREAENNSGISIQQTPDHEYFIAGVTGSYNSNNSDHWLIKIDENGHQVWKRTIIEKGNNPAKFVMRTSDGGYILIGIRRLNENEEHGIWLIRTDPNGSQIWNRTFDGGRNGVISSIQQTVDGGYILAGETELYGSGDYDAWLIKTDLNGNQQWNKTFGGAGYDDATYVRQTSDSGYILIGKSESNATGKRDVWLVKTDTKGNQQWDKTFGEINEDNGWSVQQTSDGGYILAGETELYESGDYDAWLIKTDENGNQQWNKTFGGGLSNQLFPIQQSQIVSSTST